jgi:hypothetical protein
MNILDAVKFLKICSRPSMVVLAVPPDLYLNTQTYYKNISRYTPGVLYPFAFRSVR